MPRASPASARFAIRLLCPSRSTPEAKLQRPGVLLCAPAAKKICESSSHGRLFQSASLHAPSAICEVRASSCSSTKVWSC
eukprot:3021225-Pleurochrysis_carterae.AAC.2